MHFIDKSYSHNEWRNKESIIECLEIIMCELDREENFKLLAGRDFAGCNLVYQTLEASCFDCPWLVTILNAVAQVLEDEHRYLVFLRSQCRQDGDTLVHVLLEEVACG